MELIAIIGMGCRFPGAQNPDAFWDLLRDGVDAVTEVPPDRWNIDAFYDPNPGVPGKMNTRWGGFLPQVDTFDPHFFGIAPREAIYMDPQQRLLLEVAWESLEHAGQVPEQLARSQTGVFIGISSNDYQQVLKAGGDTADINAYLGTGNAFSIAANRLSYFFDFRGPSLAIDTACSSSLVAVHLACQSLRNRESNLAIAGGVNLLLRPEVTIIFSQAQMMAPDGRCKTFDARANGYVRGEGCGVIVLKRLKDAERDGDRILALIRGSAINQDGRSNGITAPNGLAQEAVIRQALSSAELSSSEIDYIELHGTGTALGDPIEAQALGHILAQGRSRDERWAVGSVKTNIGHLEAAAGIAGLMKLVLSLQHRQIPGSLHFQTPNPYLLLDQLSLSVQTKLEEWPERSNPARAGVSSFGFGGTNAHVVLEAAPQTVTPLPQIQKSAQSAYVLPLSAKTPEALQSLVQDYQSFLAVIEPEAALSLQDLCYTASLRRNHHDHRLSLTFRNRAELATILQADGRGDPIPGLSSGIRKRNRKPKLAFVFAGQGPQWWAMGRELWQQEPLFRSVIEQCDTLLSAYADWSLAAELLAAEPQSRLGETEIAQPVLLALQIALTQLWQSWGVQPLAVVGHSLGEIAAAHVAGVLTLEEALRIAYHRGRLMQQGTGLGKMAAVELSRTEAEQWLTGDEAHLAIAAINSPTSVVLSGSAHVLEQRLAQLQQQGIFTKLLPVNYAFHSPQMEPFAQELTQTLLGLQPKPTQLRLISTVTGQICQGEELDAQHWGRTIREPVQFANAITQLAADQYTLFLEISPHPVLAGYMTQCLGAEAIILPSLRRQSEERGVMLSSLGSLYTQGYPVNWQALYPLGARCISLPTYPWQRSRYWADTLLDTAGPQPSAIISPPNETQSYVLNGSRQALLETEPSDRPKQLETFYQTLLAKVMGVSASAIDPQTPLLSLGLDSLMAVEIHKQIETQLSVAIPWEEFPGLTTTRFINLVLTELGNPTPASNSTPQKQADLDNQWLKCFSPRPNPKLRLFCFPYAGGGASLFRAWSESLPTEIELYPIQLPGREDRLGEKPFTRITPLVQALAPILEPYLNIPFAFYGHSLGALVSFELTREFRKQGYPSPAHLFISARSAPHLMDLNLPIHHLPEPKFREALRQLQGTPTEILDNDKLMELLSPTIRADLAIAENYIYAAEPKLSCPITAYGGQSDPIVKPPDLESWRDQTDSTFTLQLFPSNHFFLHHDRLALLSAIAQELTQPFSLKS